MKLEESRSNVQHSSRSPPTQISQIWIVKVSNRLSFSLSPSSFLALVASEIFLRMFAVQFRDFNLLDLKTKI